MRLETIILQTRDQTTDTRGEDAAKVKLSRYAMQAPSGRVKVLILDLDIRRGSVVSMTPRSRFTPGKGPLVPTG
jgi:hypothetical protein